MSYPDAEISDAELRRRCGVYCCAECGGVFPSVGATGVGRRLAAMGISNRARPFVLLGGKKICEPCSAKHRRRRPGIKNESFAQSPDALKPFGNW